jgi:predicted sulfurtransferase
VGRPRDRVRRSLTALTAAAVLLIGAAPAAPPDLPVDYISVEELKALLDRKERAVIVDVRTRPEYDALHIAGARSIPLRTMREHTAEVPRSGLVVFY